MSQNCNIARYFVLLESLEQSKDEKDSEHKQKLRQTKQVPDESDSNAAAWKRYLEIVRKYVHLEATTVSQKIKEYLSNSPTDVEVQLDGEDSLSAYVAYMEYVLLEIIKNVNFESDAKEDLISTHHMNLCIENVQNLAVLALRQQLHPLFRKTTVFANADNDAAHTQNYALLRLHIEVFGRILKIKQFHVANAMELVLRDYMAAIFSLFLAHNLAEYHLEETAARALQDKLNYLWNDVTKMEYFRNILLLKSIPQLPSVMQKQLHQELLQKLQTADGFTTLVATLQTAQKSDSNTEKQTFEVIAKIVAFRGHTKRFQRWMIAQIFKFFNLCLNNTAMLESMGAGLLALRRLYDLNEENRTAIKDHLNVQLKKLTQPEDLLSGLILMDHHEFSHLFALLYQLFCTSVVECLPSALLIRYLPMLLQLYYNIPAKFIQKQQIGALTIRCLHNQSDAELQRSIEKLYTLNSADCEWQQLHARILIQPNMEQLQIDLKIAPSTYKQDFNISLALPELLMHEQFHILTYKIFMILLQFLPTLASSSSNDMETKIDLLQSEEELLTFLNQSYAPKVEVILTLNALANHPPLHAQIAENAKEFLQLLQQLIERRLAQQEQQQQSEFTDQTLLLMLTLAQELLEHAALAQETFCSFMPALQQLQKQTANQLVQQRIAALNILLSGDLKAHAKHNTSAFNTARTLIESPESHLQVYGMQMLTDLLKRRDETALANGHVIIALALHTLKSKESYTFLNCVRLFVALIELMEAEVLDVLSDEYLRDDATMDYRLIVGEALIKVSKELGPLCYKYKDILLNCFMQGARSNLDEFRMSSYANLAQMCRILCYQVQKFFEELLLLIDCELTTGKYLPAKRAAVLVLSELLAGMDNLLDFEEMLLPIYRLLKTIESAEHYDDKMRLHAANGLQILSAKCKKLLFPEQQLQKEIQIFGIKDKHKNADKQQKHILEID